MMDFMSHFTESMLCSAMRSSPGFRGDRAEFPSPAAGGAGMGGDRAEEVNGTKGAGRTPHCSHLGEQRWALLWGVLSPQAGPRAWLP